MVKLKPTLALYLPLLLCLCTSANAQPNQSIDFWSDEPDPRFTQERSRVAAATKQMLDGLHVPSTNNFPNIPDPVTGQTIDIDAIAERYRQMTATAAQHDQVMVFISFSMPPESIKRLIREAHRVDGVLVLQGFVEGSYQKTAERIVELGASVGNIQINPDAFHKYKVTQVPTFALIESDKQEQIDLEGCALPDSFVSVVGDVSLRYAMEAMARQREGDTKRVLDLHLRQLGDGR